MSQEKLNLTRRGFQAFHDRDLDALLAVPHDDVEAFPFLAGMEGGYRGHDGIRRPWRACSAPSRTSARRLSNCTTSGDSTMAVPAHAGSRSRERHALLRRSLAREPFSTRGSASAGAPTPGSARPSKPWGCRRALEGMGRRRAPCTPTPPPPPRGGAQPAGVKRLLRPIENVV